MSLLAGVRVVDLSGEPGQIAGRILADLGAEVMLVEPPEGHVLRREPPFRSDTGESLRFAAWSAGKQILQVSPASSDSREQGVARISDLVREADIVLATPGWPGTMPIEQEWRAAGANAVWVDVTPFGAAGPRSTWKATDIGVMASSGNMYATGDPDRAPVACSEPSAYAHTGPEVVIAALSALASGVPQHVDVSMQEAVMVASMCAPARAFKTGLAGRRSGASIGRTKEIWLCKDGYVSFGLRGGAARVRSLEKISELVRDAGLSTPALRDRDWASYNHNVVSDAELRAIEAPIGAYFRTKTMAELYEIACETNLMLAPACSPREICASAQLEARGFFGPLGPVDRAPTRFVVIRECEADETDISPRTRVGSHESGAWRLAPSSGARGAWEGTRIVEFGSGAAGPIATRYFAENGAMVVRIESRTRPDFLRTYALGPSNPHGLEGSDMFDGLNAGKLSVTLNLKHPKGKELAKRLIGWADAVAENFAPRAMRSLGLDYDSLASDKPDLVMLSACLQGQTGPYRDYPGFGGQGSALSGYNFLTGWPDREPLGPAGTITDSLSPRFAAAALAAALISRKRTGKGVYLDLSQVEAAVYSLSPWVMDYTCNDHVSGRRGNRSERSAPHGVFACKGEDRWIAIACWGDEEWRRLAAIVGIDTRVFDNVEDRLRRASELEASITSWTAVRDRDEIAELLQAAGIEAVPVQDFVDVLADPQLSFRKHFVEMEHPLIGKGVYERNGFRLSRSQAGYERTGPTLGQDNAYVLGEILGLSGPEQAELAAQGALE